MKKRRLKKKVYIIGIVAVIIISFILFSNLKLNKNPFLGTWVSEGGTIYEFKEKNRGVMTVALSDYKFTYKVKDNILSIDFEDKRAVNTDYKYSFKKDKNKCILTSDRGTFIFTKK